MLSKLSKFFVKKKTISGYKVIHKFSENVFLVKCTKNNKICVIKVINTQKTDDIIKILTRITQYENYTKYIIEFYDNFPICIDNIKYTALLIEYIPNSIDLYHYNNQINSMISSTNLKRILEQLVKAVTFLHKLGIYHRDIKPENILVCCDNTDDPRYWDNINVKLIDFDLSCIDKHVDPSKLPGSILFTSPEVARLTLLDVQMRRCMTTNELIAADIYGIGASLYQLWGNQHPFPQIITIFMENKTGNTKKILSVISSQKPIPMKYYSKECAKTITKLVTKETKERINNFNKLL